MTVRTVLTRDEAEALVDASAYAVASGEINGGQAYHAEQGAVSLIASMGMPEGWWQKRVDWLKWRAQGGDEGKDGHESWMAWYDRGGEAP